MAQHHLQKHAYSACAFILVVLCIPFTATFTSNEVNWQLSDFVVMAVLLLALYSAIAMSLKLNTPWLKRLAITSVFMGFVWVWVELAVGIVF